MKTFVKLWVFTVLVVWWVLKSTLFMREIRSVFRPRPIVSFEEIESSLQTGDLLFFSSGDWTGSPPGFFRKAFFPAEFTHVGVIYRDGEGKLSVMENTDKPSPYKYLQERVAEYNHREQPHGCVVVGMLEPRATTEDLEMRQLLVDNCLIAARTHSSKPIRDVGWLMCHEKGWINSKQLKTNITDPIPTCSAFVAWVLHQMDILDIPVTESGFYLPHHFSRQHLIVDVLNQRGGFGISGKTSQYSIQEFKLSQ